MSAHTHIHTLPHSSSITLSLHIPTTGGWCQLWRELPLNSYSPKKKKKWLLTAAAPTLSGSLNYYHSSVRYVACSPLTAFSQATSLRHPPNQSHPSGPFYFSICEMSYHQRMKETWAFFHPGSQYPYSGRESFRRWSQILRKLACRWVSACLTITWRGGCVARWEGNGLRG